ncbi:MAG: hypothetical protein WC980_06085 [Candidatus Brocadiia bacterium]
MNESKKKALTMKLKTWFTIGIFLLAFVMLFNGCQGGKKDDSGSSAVTAPSNLSYTKVTNTATSTTTNIIFAWTDNSADETEFVLYVRPFGTTDWEVASNGIPADVTSYSLSTSALNEYNYQFCLIAYNGSENILSEPSNILAVNLP